MKKIFLVALPMVFSYWATAQSIDRKVIASGGGTASSSTVQVSFTIGETAIQYLSSAGASLSQGFQQGNESTTGIRNLNSIDARLTVFPNPFHQELQVKSDKILKNPTFTIVDALGRNIKMSKKEIENGKHWRVEVSNVGAGNYWLSIMAEGYTNTIPLVYKTH